MIEAARQWATAVCFAALSGGICLLLVPKTSLNKVIKFTVSMFFLCSIFLPVVVGNYTGEEEKWEESQEKSEELSAKLSKQAEESAYQLAEKNIHKLVSKILEDSGINAIDIAIDIKKEEESGAIIHAKLSLSELYKQQEGEICKELKAAGVETELKYISDNSSQKG